MDVDENEPRQSPRASDTLGDLFVKRPRYQRERIPEFWIVDQETRVFERLRPDDKEPEVITDVMTWQPLPHIPPLSIPLGDFFDKANR